MLLGKDGGWKTIDMGLVHSSSAPSLANLILERLRQDGDIEPGVSPNFLVRNWPPAFKEWSTKAARDAFFASPQFPRLLDPESVKDTIARGVENGMLAYVGKSADGNYNPFHWNSSLSILDVELTDEMFIVQRETAEAYLAGKKAAAALPFATAPTPTVPAAGPDSVPASVSTPLSSPATPASPNSLASVTWNGDVPPQKWMNFYTKVLAKFVMQPGLRIGLNVEIAPPEGVSAQRADEIKVALRELGLDDTLK